MAVKSKESFKKTRQVKNNDKPKKYILRGQRMQDIIKKYYQIKRNLIIVSMFSKIRIDTELKFSTYTNTSTTYPMMYHF